MKIKIILSFILLLVTSHLATSQVIPQGWGGVYNDNMIPTDPAQNGTSYGYDLYIYFFRCIKNTMADKDSNYNSIYSTIYSEVWATNLNTNGFKVGNFTLNGVNYSQKFIDANREYWVHPEHYDFSPFETGNLDFMIYEKNRNGVGVDPNGTKVRFNDMTFPQYFIISEAPDKIQVSSEQDFTVKVANAKYNQTSGFALPQPDALNLYFYTKKGNRNNAFKTPVTFIPTPGGEQFSFTYPGKNVKYDYSVNYFDLGEGASVVKAAKSYEEILNLKGVRVRCLITFVNIAERTYQYVP